MFQGKAETYAGPREVSINEKENSDRMQPEAAPFLMLGLAVTFFAFLSLLIYLRHRKELSRHQERVLALEKGIPMPPAEARPADFPRVYLLRGLQWFCVGLAVSLTLLAIASSDRRPMSLESRLSEAQFLKARGASDDQVREYLKSAADEMEGMSYAAAAVGLVPMGVGLAYLIFYRKETERAEQREATAAPRA